MRDAELEVDLAPQPAGDERVAGARLRRNRIPDEQAVMDLIADDKARPQARYGPRRLDAALTDAAVRAGAPSMLRCVNVVMKP